MNKMVSLPVAAALPIAAPVLLAPEPAAADDSKLLALVEEYIAAQRLTTTCPPLPTKCSAIGDDRLKRFGSDRGTQSWAENLGKPLTNFGLAPATSINGGAWMN